MKAETNLKKVRLSCTIFFLQKFFLGENSYFLAWFAVGEEVVSFLPARVHTSWWQPFSHFFSKTRTFYPSLQGI